MGFQVLSERQDSTMDPKPPLQTREVAGSSVQVVKNRLLYPDTRVCQSTTDVLDVVLCQVLFRRPPCTTIDIGEAEPMGPGNSILVLSNEFGEQIIRTING